MSRLSIGGRIYLCVGVVLALLAALAAQSFLATSKLATVFSAYRDTARETLFLNDNIEDLFQARLAAFSYRIDPSVERAAEVSSNIEEITALEDEADRMFAEDPDVLQELSQLKASMAQYKEAFARMTALQGERETIVARLSTIGPKARTQLTSIMTSAYRDGDPEAAYYAGLAQQELMLGRFYSERFLLTNEQAAFDRSSGHLTDAKKQLQSLLDVLENPERRQYAADTIADLDAYLDSADAVRGVITARNEIRDGTLDVIGPKVQETYERVLDKVVAEQNVLGPEGTATAEQTLTLVLVLSALALLVGAAVAGGIARWTSKSVRETVDTMTELASGNLHIKVKGAEHKHELGMMAKALHVFKDSAEAAAKLQADKAAQAEADARAAAERRERDDALGAEIVALVEKVTSGDLSDRISTEGRDGILAEVCGQFNQLVNGLEAILKDVGQTMDALANGDLNQRITAHYGGAFGDLSDSMNRTADQLATIVGQIKTATAEVENAAGEISTGTEDLSKRTEQAASNLEETAASTEEMAATVKQNAKNAKNASQEATSADQSAKIGGEVVQQAVNAMAQIEQSAQKITDIISVIDEIAFQTNLLALNASVEAARAGEAGKGFAVVAQEVRQLAQRSAQAASDIKTLIQGSNGQVKDGVQLVNKAGEALAEIVGSIGKVAEIVGEISNASQEQAAGVQEINSSVASMDEMTQQNSALVEESSAAARALSDQAGKLGELMAFFKLNNSGTLARSKPASPRQPTNREPALAAAGDDAWAEF